MVLGALLLSGCGKQESFTRGVTVRNPEAKTTADAPDQIVVAALGDSITAGHPGWDPDPRVRQSLERTWEIDERSQWMYWAARKYPEVEFRNCGVAAQRVADVSRRLSSCARQASAVVIQAGANDLAAGADPAVVAQQLDALVQQAMRAGLVPVLAEVTPRNGTSVAERDDVVALNAAIALIGTRRNIRVLPFFKAVEDGRAAGKLRSAITPDGVHLTVVGYRRLGRTFELPLELPKP